MSSAPTPEEIAPDARWLAQALDPAEGMVRMIAMDREAYRTASFLDDRMLQSPVDAHVLPWAAVEEAMVAELRRDARWIFHIGHVGSTLVSRLLGEIDGVLAVREPRLLRDLALTSADVRAPYVAFVPKLMSRSFASNEVACVKATSFVNEVAAELVPPGQRALFMFASPRNYLELVALAGEKRDMILKIALETQMRPVSFRDRAIEVALVPGADPGFIQTLSARLRAWTGQTWGVSVSRAPAEGPTIRDVKQQHKAQADAEAADDPLVKAILERFPGSKVTVTLREEQIPDTAYEDAFFEEREDD